jgi:hypothetical protein
MPPLYCSTTPGFLCASWSANLVFYNARIVLLSLPLCRVSSLTSCLTFAEVPAWDENVQLLACSMSAFFLENYPLSIGEDLRGIRLCYCNLCDMAD